MDKFLDSNGFRYFLPRLKEIIPTKTSELTNDSGFITKEDGLPDAVAPGTAAIWDGEKWTPVPGYGYTTKGTLVETEVELADDVWVEIPYIELHPDTPYEVVIGDQDPLRLTVSEVYPNDFYGENIDVHVPGLYAIMFECYLEDQYAEIGIGIAQESTPVDGTYAFEDGMSINILDDWYSIIPNETYTVTFDGVQYRVPSASYEDGGYTYYFLGDPTLEEYPFCTNMWEMIAVPGEHSVKIEGLFVTYTDYSGTIKISGDVVTPIDKKFIPIESELPKLRTDDAGTAAIWNGARWMPVWGFPYVREELQYEGTVVIENGEGQLDTDLVFSDWCDVTWDGELYDEMEPWFGDDGFLIGSEHPIEGDTPPFGIYDSGRIKAAPDGEHTIKIVDNEFHPYIDSSLIDPESLPIPDVPVQFGSSWPSVQATDSECDAQGKYSVALGHCSRAGGTSRPSGDHLRYTAGEGAHAEGGATHAKGAYSHAEGELTQAMERGSHAEGQYTIASGDYGSHAEGGSTTASGGGSHAEGSGTIASGTYSHAEGCYTEARGDYSHAEGYKTIAASQSQHVVGEYNVVDSEGRYKFIVGAGSYYGRKNALALTGLGDLYVSGRVYQTTDAWNGSGGSVLMTELKLTYDGSSIKRNGTTQTFNQIKQYCDNANYFVYLVYENRLYIPQYVTASAIYFICTYPTDTMGVMIRRITMTSNNVVTASNTELQPKLTAGENVTIVGNVISATGGGGDTEEFTNAEVNAIWNEVME